jgi:hypothetical protein
MSGPRGQGASLRDVTAEAHPTFETLLASLLGSDGRRRRQKRKSGYVARDVIQSESNTLERRESSGGDRFQSNANC